MGILLSVFSSKITWVVLAIVLVGVMLGIQQTRIVSLKNTIDNQKRELEIASVELSQAKDIITRWKTAYEQSTLSIKEQNSKITKLEVEVQKRIAASIRAMKLAEAMQVKAEQAAEQLTRMELPKDEYTALTTLLDLARANGLH